MKINKKAVKDFGDMIMEHELEIQKGINVQENEEKIQAIMETIPMSYLYEVVNYLEEHLTIK